MNDVEILQQALDKLMEGNAEAARIILQKSNTPALREFARRCENPTDDTAYEVRKDLEKYQRSIGSAPSEGMALKSALEQAIAKNAPPGFFGNSQTASTSKSQALPTPQKAEKPGSKGCFIATACYGDYNHPAVQDFRWFRDHRLGNSSGGRLFTQVYYRFSPPLAEFLQTQPRTASAIRRFVLTPLLSLVRRTRATRKL